VPHSHHHAKFLKLTNLPKFDWKAIATKMGHADAKKARDAWYSVCDKLTAAVGAEEKKGIDLAPAQKELLGFVIETMNASVCHFVVVLVMSEADVVVD